MDYTAANQNELPATRSTGRNPVSDANRPFRGRRITWTEFYELHPDRRPANDNNKREDAAELRAPTAARVCVLSA